MKEQFSMRQAGIAVAIAAVVVGMAWYNVRAADRGLVDASRSVLVLADDVNERLGLVASTIARLDLPQSAAVRFQTLVPINGEFMTLDLAPHSVRAANYRLLVQGEDGALRDVDPGPEHTLRGTISEISQSVVAASLLDDGLHARILMPDGGEYWIEPIAAKVGGAGASDHAVYRQEDVIQPDKICGNDTTEVRVGAPAFRPAPIARIKPFDPVLESHGPLTVAQLANDADFEYFQAHGANTATDIEAVTNTMNIQYERDVGITHLITTTIVRTAEPDPYSSTNNSVLLNQFRNEWNNNQAGIARDVAQLFTGKNIDGSVIGTAFALGAVCNLSNAYEFVQSDFSSNLSCKTDLSAHELGHLWNAFHCSCGFPNSYTMNSSITCANRFNPVDSIPSIVGWRSIETCFTNDHTAPANDLCGNAEVTCTGTLDGTTDSAGNEATGSCIGASTGAPDVWYSYTPNASGTVTVNTCGTVYDTTLSIYDACGGTELVCNDDSNACGTQSRKSSVSLSVSAGSTYLIRVFGWRKQAGDFTLSIAGPDCGGAGGGCNNNDNCEPGEDCNNCPNDCRSKTNGNPNSRYCCDGDLSGCGEPRCSEGGFFCPCTGDPDCDDGDPCNGTESCVGGSCQIGLPPPCGNGDGCCPSGCTLANDDDCQPCEGNRAPCSSNADCCSGNCKNGSCRGN